MGGGREKTLRRYNSGNIAQNHVILQGHVYFSLTINLGCSILLICDHNILSSRLSSQVSTVGAQVNHAVDSY